MCTILTTYSENILYNQWGDIIILDPLKQWVFTALKF